MSKITSASVNFCFQSSLDFLTLSLKERGEVKKNIKADLDKKLKDCLKEVIKARSIPFEVDDPNKATSETKVKEMIVKAVKSMSDNNDTFEFAVSSLQSVNYVWDGDIRYCEHSYGVKIAPEGEKVTPWVIEHSKGEETILVRATW